MTHRFVHRVFQVVLIAITALAAAAALNARTAVGNLAGTVLDAQGKPVLGASVVIQTSDGEHPHATRTDAQGHFEFVHFQTGQYDLRAEFQGANSHWALRVIIRSNKTTKITLRLTQH